MIDPLFLNTYRLILTNRNKAYFKHASIQHFGFVIVHILQILLVAWGLQPMTLDSVRLQLLIMSLDYIVTGRIGHGVDYTDFLRRMRVVPRSV